MGPFDNRTGQSNQEDFQRKKQEIIDNLRRLHTGVYDRIINVCHPIHSRYNQAVTRLVGQNIEAIVVDTEETARNCIKYLKEKILAPETFLPLNSILAKPLKERLCTIKAPT